MISELSLCERAHTKAQRCGVCDFRKHKKNTTRGRFCGRVFSMYAVGWRLWRLWWACGVVIIISEWCEWERERLCVCRKRACQQGGLSQVLSGHQSAQRRRLASRSSSSSPLRQRCHRLGAAVVSEHTRSFAACVYVCVYFRGAEFLSRSAAAPTTPTTSCGRHSPDTIKFYSIRAAERSDIFHNSRKVPANTTCARCSVCVYV